MSATPKIVVAARQFLSEVSSSLSGLKVDSVFRDTACRLIEDLACSVELLSKEKAALETQTSLAGAINMMTAAFDGNVVASFEDELDAVYGMLGRAVHALKPFADMAYKHDTNNPHPLTDVAPFAIVPMIQAGPGTTIHLGDCRRAAVVFAECVGPITTYCHQETSNADTETSGRRDNEVNKDG